MALAYKQGTLLSPTATGNQVLSGFGFTPKLVVFFATRQTAEGFSAGGGISFGAAVSSSQRKAVAVAMDDNVTTTNTGRRQANLAIAILDNGTPTVEAEADLVSLDTDGFTLNWTTVDASNQYIVHYLALGGSDLTNVKVGEFNAPTATGNSAVSGVGFEPDTILLFGVSDDVALPSNATHASLSFGAASSTTARCANAIRNRDGVTTSQLGRYQSQSKCYTAMTNDGTGTRAAADLVSFDADGFTLNWSIAPTVADKVFYVALKGAHFKVGTETQKTSTGTKATTGVGFPPDLLLVWSVGSPNLLAEDATGAKLTLGAAVRGGSEGCVWTGGVDAVSTTDENKSSVTTKVLRMAASPSTVEAEADLSSFDADGFTLDWTTADTNAREFCYLAIGAIERLMSLAGATTPTGGLGKQTSKPLAGAITAAGSLAKRADKALAGASSTAGGLLRLVGKALAGALTPGGSLTRRTEKTLAGASSPSGGLGKLVGKAFAGAIAAIGNLTRQVIPGGPAGIGSVQLVDSAAATVTLTAAAAATVDLAAAAAATVDLATSLAPSVNLGDTPAATVTLTDQVAL